MVTSSDWTFVCYQHLVDRQKTTSCVRARLFYSSSSTLVKHPVDLWTNTQPQHINLSVLILLLPFEKCLWINKTYLFVTSVLLGINVCIRTCSPVSCLFLFSHVAVYFPYFRLYCKLSWELHLRSPLSATAFSLFIKPPAFFLSLLFPRCQMNEAMMTKFKGVIVVGGGLQFCFRFLIREKKYVQIYQALCEKDIDSSGVISARPRNQLSRTCLTKWNGRRS